MKKLAVFCVFLAVGLASAFLRAEPASVSIAGDWSIQVDHDGQSATLAVAVPEIFEKIDEQYNAIEVFNPNGPEYHRGTVLRGASAMECAIMGTVLPDSVQVRLAPDAEPLVNGTDYQLDGANGTIGRLDGGKIGADTPVYVTYKHVPMRLDSVVQNADGSIVIVQGTPHPFMPEEPILTDGQKRLANIYITGPMEKLTDANIFAILEEGDVFDDPGKGCAATLLPKTWAKLHNGEPLKILAWGDSVTECGFIPDEQRWQAQFVERLKKRFPNAKIELITEAWGGRNSDTYFAQPPGAEHNYQEKVLNAAPDLIISEFVNDAWFNAEKVEQNYGRMRDDFAKIGAEWIILTPHYVRPGWMGLTAQKNIDNDPRPYVTALRNFAAANNIPLADGSARYGRLWRRGIPYITLMTNNINHPNGFGMELFANALMALFETNDDAALWLRLDGKLDVSNDASPEEALADTLKNSDAFFTWESEKLGFLFRRSESKEADSRTLRGLTLEAMVDKTTLRVLTVSGDFPLFTLENRAVDETLSSVSSVGGWSEIIEQTDGKTLSLRFVPVADSPCCAVTVRFKPTETGGAAFDYALDGGDTEKLSPEALRSMVVRLSGDTDAPKFVWPEGSGRMFADPFAKPFDYHPTYPSGFPATMQWSAFWDETTRRGLYSGFHDPNGAHKSLEAKSLPETRAIELSYRVEIPDDLSFPDGTIVLEPFDGDWFDAAQIYKKWVRAAIWYPALDDNGRPDTPDWFKSLSVWCMFDYSDKESAVTTLRRFQEAFGLAVGVHCYNWHAIPFDNDYPHYFPTKPGFADTVIELQKNDNIHIMPYINGRLWDMHDKGSEDWRFTSDALCAATKKRDGSPYIESYLSKEQDGSKVELAVMCPTTDLWRDKVRENVLRLMNECGVDAVYIDQIAAAAPTLCMDKSHAHTLNGGLWWVKSYLSMLDRIKADMRTESSDWPCTEGVKAANSARQNKVKNHVITTECNAESYIKGLDGYLTWHWQYNGAVPAFSAVYGGAILMFGRSYSGDATAWKMKAAESLVFGEQIGWFGPDVIDRAEEFAFIRPLVRFRQSIADYFYRGEMARPPKFLDPVPDITADWQWSGNPTPVTAPSVRTGCWRLNDLSRAVVIFSNTANEPLQSRVAVSIEELGFDPNRAVLRRVDSEGNRSEPLKKDTLEKPLDFPALETWGIEISRE